LTADRDVQQHKKSDENAWCWEVNDWSLEGSGSITGWDFSL
jgi:hypothetical protein